MRQRGAGPRNITATFGFSFDFPAPSPASNSFGGDTGPVAKRRRIDEIPAAAPTAPVKEVAWNGIAAIPERLDTREHVRQGPGHDATKYQATITKRLLTTPPFTAEHVPLVATEQTTTAIAPAGKPSKGKKHELSIQFPEAEVPLKKVGAKTKRKLPDEATKTGPAVEPPNLRDLAVEQPTVSRKRRKLLADDNVENPISIEAEPVDAGDDSFVAAARSQRPRVKQLERVKAEVLDQPDAGVTPPQAAVAVKAVQKVKAAAKSAVPEKTAKSRSTRTMPGRKQHLPDRVVADAVMSEDELSSSLVASPAPGTTADRAADTAVQDQKPIVPVRKVKAGRKAATTRIRTSRVGKPKALLAENEGDAKSTPESAAGRDGGGLDPNIAANSDTQDHAADETAPITAINARNRVPVTSRAKTVTKGQKREAVSKTCTDEGSRSGREALADDVVNHVTELPVVPCASPEPVFLSRAGGTLKSGRSKRAMKAPEASNLAPADDVTTRQAPNAVVASELETVSAAEEGSVRPKARRLACGGCSSQAVATKLPRKEATKPSVLETASPGVVTQVDEHELSLPHSFTEDTGLKPKSRGATKRRDPKAAKLEKSAIVRGRKAIPPQGTPAPLRDEEPQLGIASPRRRPLQEAEVNVIRRSVSPEKAWPAGAKEQERAGPVKPATTAARWKGNANTDERSVPKPYDASLRPTGTAAGVEAKTGNGESKTSRLVEAECRNHDAQDAADEDVDWLFAPPPLAAVKSGPVRARHGARSFAKVTNIDLDDLVMNIASIAPVKQPVGETPGVSKPAAKATRRRK